MTTKTLAPQYARKRKFFLVLPVLVLPFITLLFWALGGGKGSNAQAQEKMAMSGLNVELPDAYLKEDKVLNKLSYYEKAASDSAKLEELMKSDPYYLKYKRAQQDRFFLDGDTAQQILDQRHWGEPGSLSSSPYRSNAYTDPNEAKVYQKLGEINTAMNVSTEKMNHRSTVPESYTSKRTTISSDDIDRLEQMMERTNRSEGGEDQEIKQLNEMMDKIMNIQNPERVKEQMDHMSQASKDQVFAVSTSSDNEQPSLLENHSNIAVNDTLLLNSSLTNGFFSLEDEQSVNLYQQNTIQAAIHGTQTLVDGSVVKLRLLNDVYVNGVYIPKGSFVFGKATLQGERLNIKVVRIRYKSALLPVQLSVVDLDGMEGIYIPGAITRDVANSSAERTLQSIGATTLDPSLGAQAANVGIEAAKNLMGKKAKLVRITLKGDYQVLLLDEKQKSSF